MGMDRIHPQPREGGLSRHLQQSLGDDLPPFWIPALRRCSQLLVPHFYDSLKTEVEDTFRDILRESLGDETVSAGNAMVTHSCRTIFDCFIRTLLARNGGTLRICTNSVHFGSFYRILKAMNLEDGVDIDFYEIDLQLDDWSLSTDSVSASTLKSCDVVLCMHLFGVPLDQTVLFELGHKFGIPVVEDCVQSGSLYSHYKGHPLSDVCFWSGGLDKTPSCFGGGFGFFKATKHGDDLYQSTLSMLSSFDVDSWSDRFQSLLNQLLHLMLAKNYCFSLNLVGYVGAAVMRQQVKWSELQLSVRRNKAIAPFQHRKSVYLRRPSIYQFLSIRHGLNKTVYSKYAAEEIAKRDLLLKCIPTECRSLLFPWMTPKVVAAMRANEGISEFLWVFAANGDRKALLDHLDESRWISMINTTWVHNEGTALEDNVGRKICDGLTYLPNLCQLDERQIRKLADDLVQYAKDQELVELARCSGPDGRHDIMARDGDEDDAN